MCEKAAHLTALVYQGTFEERVIHTQNLKFYAVTFETEWKWNGTNESTQES